MSSSLIMAFLEEPVAISRTRLALQIVATPIVIAYGRSCKVRRASEIMETEKRKEKEKKEKKRRRKERKRERERRGAEVTCEGVFDASPSKKRELARLVSADSSTNRVAEWRCENELDRECTNS